jgi:glycosyltransferase involved in cell wall biosynthesis
MTQSAEKPRVLVCAFADVPGPSSVGVRAEQMLLAYSSGFEVDALSLKGQNLTHIQRVGAARMMRVPAPASADPVVAFRERLGAYRRALLRQLDNEPYSVVLCLDLFSAAAALPSLGPARLVIDVADVPSQSFARRYPVAVDDVDTQKEWELGERAAFRAATAILTPSRSAARTLASAVDPRRVRVAPRMVDTRIFTPPTVEIALDDARSVVFLGGREGGPSSTLVVSVLQQLARRVPGARPTWVGSPLRDHDAAALLAQAGLAATTLVDVDSQRELQAVLAAADIVVVAADADDWGVPHRALEAMACGRAVIVAGNEGAYREHITADQHAVVVVADHVDAVLDAVGTLVEDDSLRARLASAGQRQAMRFDLAVRADELGDVLAEITGIPFACALPPLEDITVSIPVVRAIPSAVSPQPVALSVAATLSDDDDMPEVEADDVHDVSADLTSDTLRPARTMRSTVPLSAARALSSADSESGDVWAGDTVLEAAETPAVGARVSMLKTQSGSAPRPLQRRARSLVVNDGIDGHDDDWSRDTIADASPLPESSKSQDRPSQHALARNLLVEEAPADLTAEDMRRPGASKSLKSSQ